MVTPDSRPPDSTPPEGGALDGLRLDRASPVPLYFQVAQFLEQAIDDGRMPPGTHLDNELQLADQLGLSRPTLRRALQYLVEKGLLVRRRGVGTRVVQPKVRRPVELTSLFDDLSTSGRRPTTEVLVNEITAASHDVAEALAIEQGSPVRHVVRLRSALEQPIALMTNWLSAQIPGMTDESLRAAGMYQIMRAAGITLHAARQTIGARKATAEEARQLDEPRGAALLTMQRLTYDDDGRVVEFGTHLYAATRYSFELSLLTT